MTRLLFLVATLASLFVIWLAQAPKTKVIKASDVLVLDGDTIDHGDDRYRLVGFDTPETNKLQCAAEKALGLKAKIRLTELIKTAGFIDLEIEEDVDRHGRFLAVGRVDGWDVGTTLISEGLAREYWGGKRQSWCQ